MSIERPDLEQATPKAKKSKKSAEDKSNGNGANLGFEAQMFLAADKLRKNLEPSDYKHVVLGLIFLKYTPFTSQPENPWG